MSMRRFQLHVAIALVVAALCSSFIFYLSRPKEGKITLPTRSSSDEATERDPFDVVTPEDISEGYPIDEHTFWDKVRSAFLILEEILNYYRGVGATQKASSLDSLRDRRRSRDDVYRMGCCNGGFQ